MRCIYNLKILIVNLYNKEGIEQTAIFHNESLAHLKEL